MELRPVFRDGNAIRLGYWLIRAILAAGLLCLAAGGRARAAESLPAATDAAIQMLLAPDADAEADRAREARDLLAVDRNRKLAVISSALVDLGIHASLGVSPLKMLQSAGDLGQGVLTWSNRTPGEERALLLLAPDALGGTLDDGTQKLYERLEGRERHELVKRLLEDGDRAFQAGQLRRARLAVDRALELEPGSQRADVLADAIEARERSDRAQDALAAGPAGGPTFAQWDVRVASALLTDAEGRVPEPASQSDGATAEIARATARYEAGDRAAALDDFRRIAEGEDAAAGVARELLEDRGVNPERALDDEIWSYEKRLGLGIIGGDPLADNGMGLEPENVEFSSDGYKRLKSSYRVLRKTVNPMNLLIDTPARVWRGWRPDASALREAATRYLELEPHGARADDAREWLGKLSKDERASVTSTPFHDGYLVLPHARTRYERIAPRRVVVSAEALAKQAPELAERLGLVDASAFVLGENSVGEAARPLDSSAALELLDKLAAGLEGGALLARNSKESDVLEAVRRMDARVRSGVTLQVAARKPVTADGFGEMGTALVDGKQAHTIGEIELTRTNDKIVADRELGGDGAYCLPETPCIDRKLPVDGALYASTDAEGTAGIGAHADYREARLSVEMGTRGPHASLVLPIARWLGIVHFVPVEARVDVGLDGISAGPRVDTSAADAAAEKL
jgi:hypothetical protein